MGKTLDAYAVGDQVPPLKLPALTRHTLALYCGGSGDHNPIHTDIDYARKSGLEDVIGHGMLTMAYVARMVTDFAGPAAVRNLNVRFVGMAKIGDEIVCKGRLEERTIGENEVTLTLSVTASVGERQLVAGEALVAIGVEPAA